MQDELRGLCDIFYTMEPSIVEAVYESCDKQRPHALQQLMDMVGDTPQLNDSLRKEAFRLHKVPAPQLACLTTQRVAPVLVPA